MKSDFIKLRGSVDTLPAFLMVAERRSFRAAAAELGVSTSAVSQAVRTLEDRLGIALFHRTTRSVNLTEAGEQFLQRARPALDGLMEAYEAASSLGERPSGLLRINAARGVIDSIITPALPSFLSANPHVEVEIVADDGLTDIVAGGFDVGFRLGESLEQDMVAVRVSPRFRFVVVGSPDYFAGRGRPQRPEELADHACIRFRQTSSQGIYRWEFMDGNRSLDIAVRGPLIVNDSRVSIEGAVGGIGLTYIAEPLVFEDLAAGRLETVLTEFTPPTPGLYLYFPSRAQALPKLRAYVDHMKRDLARFERTGTRHR